MEVGTDGRRTAQRREGRIRIPLPEWNSVVIQRLAAAKAHVQITGWRMWDPEHPTEVDLSRGTLWEIHPVHRIEVDQDGTWVDLCADWPACFP